MDALNNPTIPLQLRLAASNAALAWVNAQAHYNRAELETLHLWSLGEITREDRTSHMRTAQEEVELAYTRVTDATQALLF